VASLFFEDFEVGQEFLSRGATLTESQIIDFALVYDPQPIHVDVPGAEQGPFGGLIASGFQTMALTFRLFWDTGTMSECGMGAPGIENLKWLSPVRPGDTLRTRVEVMAVRESSSKKDRGTVTLNYSGINQDDAVVINFTVAQIMRKRS